MKKYFMPFICVFVVFSLIILYSSKIKYVTKDILRNKRDSFNGKNRFKIALKESMVKITKLEKHLSSLSKSLERLWCESLRVQNTGSFCVSSDSIIVGGNQMWDVDLCKGMEKLFGPSSIVDMGAGLGHYGRCLLRREANIFELQNDGQVNQLQTAFIQMMGEYLSSKQVVFSWTGYDGAINIDLLSNNFIHQVDLSKANLWLGRKWDWVTSIEVGEHIPQSLEDNFIDNLVRHGCQGLVLTWAAPEQGGHHHVNNRPQKYIKDKMTSKGLTNSIKEEEELRKIIGIEYLKANIMVFRYKKPQNCTNIQ